MTQEVLSNFRFIAYSLDNKHLGQHDQSPTVDDEMDNWKKIKQKYEVKFMKINDN